ncbi:MAG TPA: EAL domain-containing protein, partial [Lysobacter sp.]
LAGLALWALATAAAGAQPAAPMSTGAPIGADAADTPVVFGADAYYPPLSLVDENGEPAGFDVELFREVARGAGLEPRIRLGDWDRIVQDFEAGRIQVIPVPITEARRARYLFSTPYLYGNLLVFGRRGARFVDRAERLRGHRVAAHSSDVAADVLRRIPGVTLVPVRVEGNALLEVKHGRADYALVAGFVGHEAQRRYHLRDVVALSPPLRHYEYAFAVLPHNRDLLPRINAGLERAGSRGEHDRLFRTWLANLDPQEDVYRSGMLRGAWLALPALAMVAVLAVWWRRARRRSILEAASRAQAEARIEHLAFHDGPTGLMNANGLERALGPWIARGTPFVLVRVELADLEAIEAITGREFIHALVQRAARRLADEATDGCIARVGHHAFVAVAQPAETEPDADAAMRRMVRAVTHLIELRGIPVQLECHAGAALFPAHAGHFDGLLSAAHLACSAARERTGSGRVYDRRLSPDPRNLSLLADLRTAIREGSLGFALQPKISLASRAVTGAELLVRWTHPVHGPLSPGAFVPAAERTDVISDMTLYLAARAAERCSAWKRQGIALRLALNVSANDLGDARVVDGLTTLCSGVADQLILEVTETAVMRDPAAAFEGIRRLRASGMQISLDDFGTGSASLTYLRQMAPDEVKIDRSFVSGLLESDADRSIVRSTIALAHSMRAVVTAEGIEDEATLEWLEAAGCDNAQGFFIARPMTPDAFERAYVEALRTP